MKINKQTEKRNAPHPSDIQIVMVMSKEGICFTDYKMMLNVGKEDTFFHKLQYRGARLL